jgi:hypothetical protein
MFVDLEFVKNGENVDVFCVVEASEIAPEIRKMAGVIRRFCKGSWRFWPASTIENGAWSLDLQDVDELRNKIMELNESDA